MPARQRGWTRKRKTGWQACWREDGRQRTGPQLFATKTDAKDWLSVQLTVGLSSPRSPEVTFAEHVERYLRLHAAVVDRSTIRTLRERLGATPEDRRRRRRYQTPVEAFGHLRLSELEALSLELAEWQTTLPPRYRYAIMLSLRQVLNAAVRWKLIRENPANRAGTNPQPRTRRCLTSSRWRVSIDSRPNLLLASEAVSRSPLLPTMRLGLSPVGQRSR